MVAAQPELTPFVHLKTASSILFGDMQQKGEHQMICQMERNHTVPSAVWSLLTDTYAHTTNCLAAIVFHWNQKRCEVHCRAFPQDFKVPTYSSTLILVIGARLVLKGVSVRQNRPLCQQ